MALEIATYINSLEAANPPGSDSKSQGDDHLRLIKACLKATFPFAVGVRKFQDATDSALDTLAWTLHRNRDEGVANDLVASYLITGNNDNGDEIVVARLQGKWVDPVAGSEDTSLIIRTTVAGVEDTVIAEMNSFRPITMQAFNASGTWTKPAGCRRIVVEGVGGGGGGGGTTGLAARWGAGGGGGSGNYGKSTSIDVTEITTGAVVIGTGGAGGAGAGTAGTGVTTSITISGTAYTFPGGDGAPGNTANTSDQYFSFPGTWAVAGSNTKGASAQGMHGFSSVADTSAFSGQGGASLYGVGGDKVVITTTGGANGTAAAANTGGGGSGAVSGNNATSRTGGAGGSGYLRVWEYY